ncbi:hypothetical protein LB504_000699 [Fusarium proliferatum]|nr:hypothetical protein LB504_000699 [Fusarium proliferatum]
MNQTRKAKFDGPELGGTSADFANIEPAAGTEAIGRHDRFLGLKNGNFVYTYAREDGDSWVEFNATYYYGGSLGCLRIDRLCIGLPNQAFIGIMIPDP